MQPRHSHNGRAEPLISRRRPCPAGPCAGVKPVGSFRRRDGGTCSGSDPWNRRDPYARIARRMGKRVRTADTAPLTTNARVPAANRALEQASYSPAAGNTVGCQRCPDHPPRSAPRRAAATLRSRPARDQPADPARSGSRSPPGDPAANANASSEDHGDCPRRAVRRSILAAS